MSVNVPEKSRYRVEEATTHNASHSS